jgi:hypothetical protein
VQRQVEDGRRDEFPVRVDPFLSITMSSNLKNTTGSLLAYGQPTPGADA